MKQWRKLTGVIPKGRQQPSGQFLSSQPSLNALQGQTIRTSAASAWPGDEMVEPDQDDSIEDEFRRGMEEVHKSKALYDTLTQASAALQSSAAQFAEASKTLASSFSEVAGSAGDEDFKVAFAKASETEETMAQLLQTYSGEVAEIFGGPLEILMHELSQVEETNNLYDQKRQQYEQQRARSQNQKQKVTGVKAEQDSQLSLAKDEFDESAMTLGCRLLSLEQRKAKSLLSPLLQRHMAQTRLFKGGLQQLQQHQSSYQAIARERNLPCDFSDANLVSLNIPPGPQRVESIDAGEVSLYHPTTAPATLPLEEVKAIPTELPIEWRDLLSSLDEVLKETGVEAMDVGDAVFAWNALIAAAAVASGGTSLVRPPRVPRTDKPYSSFSAPLSSNGSPVGEPQPSTFRPRPGPEEQGGGIRGAIRKSGGSLPSSTTMTSRAITVSTAFPMRISGTGRSIPMHMSGPLPTPHQVEAMYTAGAIAGAGTGAGRGRGRGTAPVFSSSVSFSSSSSSSSHPRPNRIEPLHKSGPIGRSPLGGMFTPPSSPPRIVELHILPPPPLNSLPPPAVAHRPSPIAHSAPIPHSAPVGGKSRLRAPPGLVPLPLPPQGLRGVSAQSFRRLYRSASLSSTESGASSTVAPLMNEGRAYSRALEMQRGNEAAVPEALLPQFVSKTLESLEVSDRQTLVQRVNRDDAQWRWVQSSSQHGVAPVPDWSAMPANAQANILKALARAVITHRKMVDSLPGTQVTGGTLQGVH